MELVIAQDIGFCFGVERAYKTSLDALNNSKKECQMLNSLVHNERVVKELKEKGLKFVESVDDVEKGTVIIRAHGVSDKVIQELKSKKIKIVDATCPLVKKAQDFARLLDKEKRKVVIIGEKNHAEVKAINGAIKEKGILIENEDEIAKIPKKHPIGVVIQTTQNAEKTKLFLARLKKEFHDIKIHETFCFSVMKRQEQVRDLARKTDIVLVIGSESSANTQKLVEIALEEGKKAYKVNGGEYVKPEWFNKGIKVGIASGTSAPKWIINEVIDKLKKIKDKL